MKVHYTFLRILLIFLIPIKLYSQDVITIKKISVPIEFDGRPFEPSWENLEFIPLVMHKPVFRNQPSEKSEVMITYDDEYLWVGARLYMHDAGKIFITSKKRDETLTDYDNFGILLDTYDDNENGLAFYTNPTGLRCDYAISYDNSSFTAGSAAALNYSWNTFWDVKTSIDDKGWYVEMRIPFSSLRFNPQDEITTMGLIVCRTVSANNEVDTYPGIDPKYGTEATDKPSLSATIEIEGIKLKKPVFFAPYIISGFSRDKILNENNTEYINDDTPEYNAGLDVKYSLNSNITIDFTVNPDFAQVEADDQQVNLTRYSLFFPEKRMFFQERSALFSYKMSSNANLFYSRNIGMTSEGTPVSIYGGIRMVSKFDKWEYGLINIQTKEYEATPGENFGVFRLRRQVLNSDSYIGAIITSRLAMDGYQNYAYGIDGIFHLFRDDYLDIKWAQTYDSEINNKVISMMPSMFRASLARRSKKGFAYDATYTYSGTEFNPGIGYVPQGGLQGIKSKVLYGWMPGKRSRLFNYLISLQTSWMTRLESGTLESFLISPGFELNTKKGFGGDIKLQFQKEGVFQDFELSDSVSVYSGNYSFVNLTGSLTTPTSKKISAEIELSGGEFYDGSKYSIVLSPKFNFFSDLQLSASYEYDAVRFPLRNENNSLNIHIGNIRVLYMMNTKISASLLVQYVNTYDKFITNFRLRYNPREGNDFYLVLNEDRRNENQIEGLPIPDYYNRTIMLKYTHTFVL